MINGAVGNVLDFGAKGDSTTDDTVAIQSALDSGKVIYFPAGNYKVSAALKFNSNQAIYGDGWTKTTIYTNTAVTPALITSGAAGISVNIQDMFILNQGGTAAINITDATTGILGNSRRVKFGGNPCVIGSGGGINPVMNFFDCDFTPYSATYGCIDLHGDNSYNRFTVMNSVFHCNNSTAFGISVNNTVRGIVQGICIQNNLFEEASGGAISLGSPLIANISDNYCDDNFSQNNPLIYIFKTTGSSTVPTQVTISNNWGIPGNSSISLFDGINCTISGNNFSSVNLTRSTNIFCFGNASTTQFTNYDTTSTFFGVNNYNLPQTLASGTVINQVSNYNSALCIGADLSTTNALMLSMKSASVIKPFLSFLNNTGNQIGSISTTGTAVAYNTSSDRRLKSDITSITTVQSGPVIDALQPRTFIWKANNTVDVGFIADEIQAVIPNAVSGIADAVDEDGNPVYQMLDAAQPEMMAYIIAELQALRKRVAILEAK